MECRSELEGGGLSVNKGLPGAAQAVCTALIGASNPVLGGPKQRQVVPKVSRTSIVASCRLQPQSRGQQLHRPASLSPFLDLQSSWWLCMATAIGVRPAGSKWPAFPRDSGLGVGFISECESTAHCRVGLSYMGELLLPALMSGLLTKQPCPMHSAHHCLA